MISIATGLNNRLILLLVLPLVAVGIILIAWRSKSKPNFVFKFFLSGVAGAIFIAFLAFMRSTVPIAPYETGPGAWYPVFGQCLLSLYVGFGIGVVVAALMASPYLLIKAIRKK